MIISKAIVATDNNKIYTECWPLITKGWRNINNIETVIAEIGKCDLNKSLGRIINFDLIDGIPSGFISQVIRFIIPAFFPEEVCILSDIDMLPLSKKYFFDSIKKFDDNSIVVLTSDAYGVDNKFPMCYIAAKGKYFQSLIGLEDTNKETIILFIKKLYKLNLGWITDEVFLGECLKANKNNLNIHYLNRCKDYPFKFTRIDRSNWQINKLWFLRGKYIDSHLLRPVSQFPKELSLLNFYLASNNNSFLAILKFYFVRIFNK